MVKNANEIINNILRGKNDGVILTHKQHEKLETKQMERLEHEFSRKERNE